LIGYYDFPRCREAFARGQSDARPEVRGGCYYRRRGRTHSHYTLLSFLDPYEAWDQLREYAREGARVGAVNFTSPEPQRAPTKRGITEWVSKDFPVTFATQLEENGRSAQQLRRIARAVDAFITVEQVSLPEALSIFDTWVQWAGARHFMVFKGHYRKWIEMYYEAPDSCHLIGVEKAGRLVGIFGWEDQGELSQVTIAKHTPELKGKELWIAGMKAIGSRQVLCGSTADYMKLQLGLQPRESWVFDLAKVRDVQFS
jgi:hypothetical protein